MKLCAAFGLVCFIAIATVATTKAFADDDYYRALAYADRAKASTEYEAALRLVTATLRNYPRDYQLTLARARLELRLMRYTDAEQSYRTAVAISDGAVDARVGLGWSLLHQGRCAAAVNELEAVLETSEQPAARRGIEQCQPEPGLHGSLWLTAGAALFQDHPWKRRFGDASAGLTLQPAAPVTFGLAYHYLHVTATDRRVAGTDQHELYLQTGLATRSLLLLGHGAMVWSADPQTDGSAHAGVSGRFLPRSEVLQEVSTELVASRYPDVWVGRIAAALRFALGTWSLTPGVGVARIRQETLTTGSLSLGKSLGVLTLWLSGKYGSEYRAAYLTQFALLNSEDRSVWSFSAGLRASLDAGWSLIAGYVFLRMRTPDGLAAHMHLSNVGVVYSY